LKTLVTKLAGEILKAARILTDNQKKRVDELLEIIKVKKAGAERQKALTELVNIAEQVSGKSIRSLNEALKILDYVEPRIK
jgi:hypothetical protein